MEYFKCSENSTEIEYKPFHRFDSVETGKLNDITAREEILFFVAYSLYWITNLYRFFAKMYKMLHSIDNKQETNFKEALCEILATLCFPIFAYQHLVKKLWWIELHCSLCALFWPLKYVLDLWYEVGFNDEEDEILDILHPQLLPAPAA